MQGTNQTEQSLSDTDTVNDTDFASIQKAMLDGNQEELDRLMAVETKETEDTGEETKSEEGVTSNPTEETSNEDETSDEEDKTEAATSAASTATDDKEDIEALKRELHRYKSDAGRVSYLQRRQAELERELLVLKTSNTQPTQSNGKTDTSKIELDPDVQKDINELKEIDPVLARTMERVAKAAVAAAHTQAASVVTTITQHDQEAEDYRFYTEQKQKLVEMVPQADAIFATTEWKQWKEGLTPNKRAMAESGYADEVFGAIQAFAADMHRSRGQTAPAETTTTVVQPPEKTEVTDARERKVATSATVKSPAARTTQAFDEEQAFAEIYKQVAKDNHIL